MDGPTLKNWRSDRFIETFQSSSRVSVQTPGEGKKNRKIDDRECTLCWDDGCKKPKVCFVVRQIIATSAATKAENPKAMDQKTEGGGKQMKLWGNNSKADF